MDASRLLTVVDDIVSDSLELQPLLNALIQQYTAARDAPTQDNTPAIQKALAALHEHIDTGPFVQYTPSKIAVLDAIHGTQSVGSGLKDRLNTILSVPGQTTAGIVTGLTDLKANIDTFIKACTQTKTGLEKLGVAPYAISPGEFEVGVLIPEQLVEQKLGPLAKELEAWNIIIRGFQEAAGEEEREVTCRLIIG